MHWHVHSPAGHGWKIDDNTMCPVLMTKSLTPASILELVNCQCIRPVLMTKSLPPASILELINCQCIRSSSTQNCSCSNNGPACIVSCMTDENCRNTNKSCCYDSDNVNLPEIDADD